MSKINLLPHNMACYQAISEANANGENITCILNATGTGKTYISLYLAEQNPNKTFLIVTPLNSIKEYLDKIINSNNLTNVSVITYQYLINKNKDELRHIKFDYLILDEFHHLGAPVWGSRIEELIRSHRNANVLGISAYSIRDRGTPFERDMAEPNGNEIFSDKIVYSYDLVSAMTDGVLPIPKYRSIHYKLFDDIESLSKRISKKDPHYKEYLTKLYNAKKQINEEEAAKKLVLDNIKPDSKVIYFCPVKTEKNVNTVDAIMQETYNNLIAAGYKEDEFVFYKSTYDDKDSNLDRNLFYHDKDHSNSDASNKLRIMFTINQYNEGLHVPNVDTVILGRDTSSDIVFFEQIGRALSVNDKNITPTIIDLTDNYIFISELVTKLTHNKRKQNSKTSTEPSHPIFDKTDLDFDYQYHDIYQLLQELKDKIIKLSWEEAFDLASAYYNKYNNLKIPSSFRTIDGITSSNTIGYELGTWIIRNRVDYKNGTLSQDKIDKLNSIGMLWQTKKTWEESFELASSYYQEHGDLGMISTYITEDGYALGQWIANQRTRFNKGLLTPDQILRLESIYMEWNKLQTWEDSYSLLTKYYEHYGDINVPWEFKTSNGIDYDAAGYNLYSWLYFQKTRELSDSLPISRKEQLEKLGITWLSRTKPKKLTSDEYLVLLKNYYETYGNLDIKRGFKTKNGITKDERGYDLGAHISRLRTKYKQGKLSSEEIDIYNSIGMIWQAQNNKPLIWEEAYQLAEMFFAKNLHLNVPATYKTKNGFDYEETGFALGNWIYLQRKGKETLEQDRIDKLNKIHMIWFPKKDNDLIIKLAKKHNLEKYLDILLTLPYQELKIKINYLLEIDALLEIDDHLNPVITASKEALKDICPIDDILSTKLHKKGKNK